MLRPLHRARSWATLLLVLGVTSGSAAAPPAASAAAARAELPELPRIPSLETRDPAPADLADVDDLLERGDFGPLREWLGEHVHVHGRKLRPPELLRRVTGQEIAVAPFLRYLREKLADTGLLPVG